MDLELGIERFMRWFQDVIREFYYLNDHYDTNKNSFTDSYDRVFTRWKRDIYNKYKHMILHMHWVNDSHLVSENEVVLNVMFQSTYLFELKYKFGDQININFSEYLTKFKEIAVAFNDACDQYDFKTNQEIKGFDPFFKNWKKEYKIYDNDIILDIAWKNNEPLIADNDLYLNIMYKDDYLFQVKYIREVEMDDNLQDDYKTDM